MDNAGQVLSQARTRKRHYAAVILIAAGFAALFWLGYRPWKDRQTRIYAASEHIPQPVVSVVKVSRAPARAELLLPGALSAVTETPIYARSEGYVKKRLVDIGDHVKIGQLLVEIDTPELDEQLRQAYYRYDQFMAQSGATKAALVQAKANLKLAEVNLHRSEQLVKAGILAQQDLDDKQATYGARAADVSAAQANVDAAEQGKRAVRSDIERFLDLTAFKKVTAPFDGLITVRNCEVGNLISAQAVANGRELFRLADPRELRVFINVPQPDAPSIHAGMPVDLALSEFPGRMFPGKVARTAQSLDPASRTLLVDVRIANRDGKLMPGMFGDVKLITDRLSAPLLIPGDTAVVRAEGTFVAVMDASKKVHFQKLAIGRDLGKEIEVVAGLSGNEMLVVNPSDEIRDGVTVTVTKEK